MLSNKSSIYQYFNNTRRGDLHIIITAPIVITVVFTGIVCVGDVKSSVGFLLNVIPTISSIILGFLGMIIIASLSSNRVFDKMKEDRVEDRQFRDVNLFRVFVYGIFFNMTLEMILLFISLIFGFINSSFVLSKNFYIFQFFIILYLLISTFLLFYRNMDRIYQVVISRNP